MIRPEEVAPHRSEDRRGLTLLSTQHDQIKELLRSYHEDLHGNEAKKHDIAHRLSDQLALHTMLEEVLYPALVRSSRDGQAEVSHAVEQAPDDQGPPGRVRRHPG